MEIKNLENAVIEQIRFVHLYDLVDKNLLVRMTSQEDAQISATSEEDEVVDVTGATIMNINKAKKAEYSASETMFHFGMFALQMGAEKKVATEENKKSVPATDILTAADGKLQLQQTPNAPIKYIYKMVQGQIGERYELAETGVAEPTSGKFVVKNKEITLPTDVSGQFLVEYEYDSANAMEIADNTSNFPKAVLFKASAYLRDKCTNERFLAWVVADKAEINATQLDIAFNSQGKHPINIRFVKNYCQENADLFKVIAVMD